ncbi:MAG: hypothetical protein ACMG50_10890 [Thermomonas sp.]
MNIRRNDESRPASTRGEFASSARTRGTLRLPQRSAAHQPLEYPENAAGAAHGDEAGLHVWAAPPAHDRAG